MVKYLFSPCLFFIFIGCSTNNHLLKNHHYAEVINMATYSLSCDADDQKAGQLLQKAYAEALVYYQNEIDSILIGNDQFRWTKTLDIMQKTNDLSDEISYNSAASQLICEPKIYTSEMADVREKAVVELYSAGTDLLTQHTKEKAKEAYFYFVGASELNPNYNDVGEKIQKAKKQATLKVIIDQVSAHTQNQVMSFSTKAFYKTLFYELRQNFPYSGFVHFYTPEEAQKQNIENPDQIIQIEISNFEMKPHIFPAGKNTIIQPSKKLELNDGKYLWVDVKTPNLSGPGDVQHEHEYTRLDMKSAVTLNINYLPENEVIYKHRMTWNYSEELGYSGGSSINQTHVSISPDNQIFFDHFSLSLCDQVVDRLSTYFMQYN